MPETAEAVRRPRAPSIGLAVGVPLIGWAGWISVRETSTSAGVLFELAVTVLLLLPVIGRWPLSRRRCAITALAWLVVGVAGWSLFWVLGAAVSLFVAPLAAMPALMGCGVGWDSTRGGPSSARATMVIPSAAGPAGGGVPDCRAMTKRTVGRREVSFSTQAS